MKIKNANLRPYQIEGARFLERNKNALLADEMGLGKTVQVIAWLNSCVPQGLTARVLIVCPASLKINWCKEWKDKALSDLSIDYAHGAYFPKTDIVVINYDILHKHRDALRAFTWDAVVLDEAHYIKSHDSRRTIELLGSRSKGIPAIKTRRRVALTGTPILNRPIELYTMLYWLGLDMPARHEFALQYCGAKLVEKYVRGGRRVKMWWYNGATNISELRQKYLAPIMLRRLKDDVLQDLPEKIKQVVELPNVKTRLPVSRTFRSGETFEEVVAILQKEFPEAMDSIPTQRKEEGLAKVPTIIEHLHDCLEVEEKVVCFCYHRDVVQALMEEFGDDAVCVIGGMSAEAKDEAVEQFQKGTKRLFIGNITAAGVGLTLTASRLVVFAELSWVPGEIQQAEDRCHRFGQRDTVHVQYLVAHDSVEAFMAEILVRKNKILEKVLKPIPRK